MSGLVQLVNDCWDSAEKIFDRKNFRGHITASGFVYCKKAEKLLLLEKWVSVSELEGNNKFASIIKKIKWSRWQGSNL